MNIKSRIDIIRCAVQWTTEDDEMNVNIYGVRCYGLWSQNEDNTKDNILFYLLSIFREFSLHQFLKFLNIYYFIPHTPFPTIPPSALPLEKVHQNQRFRRERGDRFLPPAPERVQARDVICAHDSLCV